MARTKKVGPDAYVVECLRFHGGLSQTELGEASGVSQSEISKYEQGAVPVPEPKLRSIAEAVKVEWPSVVHLRRFFAMLFPAAKHRQGVRVDGPPDLEVFEAARLAVMPYLIEDEEEAGPTPEEERREAEEIWTNLQRHPIPKRRELLGYTYHAARSCALMARICEASLQAADRDAQEASELADLAMFIAGRVPEELRSRAEGYCWAHLAHARRAAGDADGPKEAFALAWKLWQAGGASELLPERRMLELEASLQRAQRQE